MQKHYAVKEKTGWFGVNENSKCIVILTLVNAILFIWFFFCCFFLVKFDMFWRGPMKRAYIGPHGLCFVVIFVSGVSACAILFTPLQMSVSLTQKV